MNTSDENMDGRRVADEAKMISIRIWLPQKWQNAIAQHAKNQGISRAEFVRRCIEPHVPKDLFVPSCGIRGCTEPVAGECWCERCRVSLPKDRVYSCDFHQAENRLHHRGLMLGPVKPSKQKAEHE